MADKQSQKAGDNAQQIQTQTMVVHNHGIDEKRVREICQEKISQAIEVYTQDAEKTVRLRIAKLESVLMARLKAMEDDLEAFLDPSFQLLLVATQKAAPPPPRGGRARTKNTKNCCADSGRGGSYESNCYSWCSRDCE